MFHLTYLIILFGVGRPRGVLKKIKSLFCSSHISTWIRVYMTLVGGFG